MLFRRSKTSSLSPSEVAERLQRAEIELVDIREAAEWRRGHVRGARHIPLGELSSRLVELPADRPVAFICASGTRSRSAAATARRHGLQAHNVRGGLIMWKRAGLPLNG